MELRRLLGKYSKTEDSLIIILLELQNIKKSNFISEKELVEIANYLGVTESKVCSVMSFYTLLSTTEKGKHIIQVCNDVPCYLNDDINVLERIERELGIKVNETTKDKEFTLEHTSCIGCCNESPAMRIDNVTYTNLSPGKISSILHSVRGVKQ